MIGRGGAVFGGVQAAAADGGGEIVKGFGERGREQEVDGRAEVGRRTVVEKDRGRGRERIRRPVLGEKTQDGEVVAQDADAALRTLAARRDLGRGGGRAADGGEQSQIDRGLQGRGLLKGIDRFKEELGGRWGGGVSHGWEWFEFA